MLNNSGESVIKCKAAVAWEAGKPLSIKEVEIIATAVCHTDAYTLSGADPKGSFPMILGHEGARIVESDTVIPLYIPQCGECKFCLNPKTNLCQNIRERQFYITWEPAHFLNIQLWLKSLLLKLILLAPLDKVCLLGCGISTGYGGVGLATIMGCKVAGASWTIGVDINKDKFASAKEFGTSECINPQDFSKPIQEVLIEMTDGGVDYSFELLEACHKGWGVVVGVAASGEEIAARLFHVESVPKLVSEYMSKKIKVDEFVTHSLSFDQINEAFDLVRVKLLFSITG
ncbi:unnamed protein product [Nyctereutes procyonoides]|uniref:Alcohol dehydrogenase class-III n=1 Tax=Nyctereutes procyonoides TaxID=34880 RepID=A0A811ZZW0_NYCPR|nr:unnamed protein product [Nyctereutes procyonoides]